MRRCIRTAVAAMLCTVCVPCGYGAHAEGAWSAAHVRSDNDLVLDVLQYGVARSESFRELIAALELLDSVVYVEEGTCRHRELRACTQVMATPGGRNLLIRFNPRQPIPFAVAQLAHELYHAHEVAREPQVVDSASLQDLYRRIGDRGCASQSDNCWETRAAMAFEALVARELSRGRALSDAMMRSIGAFARTGDPNNASLGVTWPVWPATLVFDATPTAKAISVR